MANYITVEQADTYISANKLARLRDVWAHETDAEKTIALTQATKAINKLAYKGSKSVPTQANEFPRGTESTVPQDVLDACAELALAFMNGRDVSIEFEDLTVQSKRFGNVSTTSFNHADKRHIAAGIPSYEAWVLLRPYMRNFDSMEVVRV